MTIAPPLTSVDRSFNKNINKETMALNDTLDHVDLRHTFRALHLKASEYTLLLGAHRTVSKIDHILGHKTSLKYCKKLKNTLHHFWSQCNERRSQLRSGRTANIWRLNNMLTCY